MCCRCCWRRARWDSDERRAVRRGALELVGTKSAKDGCGLRSRMLMGAACCAVYRALRPFSRAVGEIGCATAWWCCRAVFAPGGMLSARRVGLRQKRQQYDRNDISQLLSKFVKQLRRVDSGVVGDGRVEDDKRAESFCAGRTWMETWGERRALVFRLEKSRHTR